ncbi:MAG: hypothetical protein ABIH66_09760 [bacterium]
MTVFYPYSGTELYELCRREGLMTGRKLLSYRFDSVLKLPGLTSAQINFFKRYFIILTRLYSALESLPPKPRAAAEKIADGVVCSRIFPYRTALVLYNVVYGSLKFVYFHGVSRVYSLKKKQFRLTKE